MVESPDGFTNHVNKVDREFDMVGRGILDIVKVVTGKKKKKKFMKKKKKRYY